MTSTTRIAIIDSNDDARASLAFFLATAGLKTRCFDNLSAFRDTSWIGLSTIALLDVSPSDKPAPATLGAIRVVRPDLALILMSGAGRFSPSDCTSTFGAIAVLEEPFDANEILPLIAPALNQRDAARRLAT